MKYSICFSLFSILSIGFSQNVWPSDINLYFSSGNSIWLQKAGESQPELLLTTTESDGRPMMVRTSGQSLFWTTYYPGTLWKSDLDGMNRVQLVDQGDETTTRAIQFIDNKIYWSNEVLGVIYKADLDGNNIETVIEGYLNYDKGFWDFEIYDGKVYWTSWDSPNVQVINLDGSGYRLFRVPTARRAFSIEAHDGRLYISDTHRIPNTDRILSVNLEGEDLRIRGTELQTVNSLEISRGRVYYTHHALSKDYISSFPISGGGDHRVEVELSSQMWQIHATPTLGPDCNENEFEDFLDIDSGRSLDCNLNGTPDSCDIASGSDQDVDQNAIPDSCQRQSMFKRGDSNSDNELDISDALFTLRVLFLALDQFECEDSADTNNDGELKVDDALNILEWKFFGNFSIPAPGPFHCGLDFNDDEFEACSNQYCN